MSIAWQTIEDALYAWVKAGTGLPAAQVIWEQPGAPRPTGQYVAMRIGPVTRVGQDWLDIDDAASPAAGAELEFFSRGQRVTTLSLQCFAGPATGIHGAVQTLDTLVSKSILPTLHDALVTAGVGILNFTPVQSTDGIVGEVFEPRALLTATLMLASEVSELGTYIETTELTNEVTGTVTEIP